MQDRDLINEFSDLKELLIQTYKIDRDRVLVKLYFTEKNDVLYMHDYDEHQKMISLCFSLRNGFISNKLSVKAILVVKEALSLEKPADFLNEGFRLYGFFRS